MLDRVFPDFNFSKHKGYGTKEHLNLLKKNSFTEIHRKTFAPVKNLIKSRNCKDSNMDTSNTNLEEINVEIRKGDKTPYDKKKQITNQTNILITTPSS